MNSFKFSSQVWRKRMELESLYFWYFCFKKWLVQLLNHQNCLVFCVFSSWSISENEEVSYPIREAELRMKQLDEWRWRWRLSLYDLQTICPDTFGGWEQRSDWTELGVMSLLTLQDRQGFSFLTVKQSEDDRSIFSGWMRSFRKNTHWK